MVTSTNLRTSQKDFQKHFEFYRSTNNIKAEDDAQIALKKAVFIIMLAFGGL